MSNRCYLNGNEKKNARLRKWFEVKITTENIFRPIALVLRSTLKTFLVWPNFPDQPNSLFYEKAFLKLIWSQNKHSLIYTNKGKNIGFFKTWIKSSNEWWWLIYGWVWIATRLPFLVGSCALFTRPTSTEKCKSNFKTGSQALFTHLKIISFQYFQFSIFSNKRYPNKPYVWSCPRTSPSSYTFTILIKAHWRTNLKLHSSQQRLNPIQKSSLLALHLWLLETRFHCRVSGCGGWTGLCTSCGSLAHGSCM